MAGRGLMGAGRKILERAGVNSAAVSRARCGFSFPVPIPSPAALLRRSPGTPPLAGQGRGLTHRRSECQHGNPGLAAPPKRGRAAAGCSGHARHQDGPRTFPAPFTGLTDGCTMPPERPSTCKCNVWRAFVTRGPWRWPAVWLGRRAASRAHTQSGEATLTGTMTSAGTTDGSSAKTYDSLVARTPPLATGGCGAPGLVQRMGRCPCGVCLAPRPCGSGCI